MTILQGKGVFGGIACGRLQFYHKPQIHVKREKINNIQTELQNLYQARDTVLEELKGLYEDACERVGQTGASIFEAYVMILSDAVFLESIEERIKNEQCNAQYAVAMTAKQEAAKLEQADDEYIKQRSGDVKDLAERLLRVLAKEDNHGLPSGERMVLCAYELSAGETVQLDKEKVQALVMAEGSVHSHMAILARMLNIPAIVGLGEDIFDFPEGEEVIVDGTEGRLYIRPDEVTRERLASRRKQDEDKERQLLDLKGKDTVTKSGKKISLYANAGSLEDVKTAMRNGAEGIGLFRSECIYLGRQHEPTEEEQFNIYKQVLEAMEGKTVIIRTLDIGADKQCDYLGLDKETNPALGFRAIRICLKRPELFRTQLRALYRASVYGRLEILFPMITSLWEILEIKQIMESVKAQLKEENCPYVEVEIGIMIETPAAVMVSEELAKEVDFFSIGTNDLTQYTLAVDRQNPLLERFYDTHHPAVIKMIRMVVENGYKHSIRVGICGELAADTQLTQEFVEMGINELSVAPSMVLAVRREVRSSI